MEKNEARFLTLILILLSVSSSIELEMSMPSFVSIAQHFGVTEKIVGLTVALNLVGFALTSFFYGPCSETVGRRKLLIGGNILMSLGAIGYVIAPTIGILLLSRIIQGAGAASSAVLIPIIVSEGYKPEKAAKMHSSNSRCYIGIRCYCTYNR